MRILETEITIAAPAHAVWSVLDDLDAFPEWNRLVPDLSGRTTFGQTVRGTLVQPNTPQIPLAPELTRVVGGRELRWLTVVPGDEGFSAEHCFVLEPIDHGATKLRHFEIFDGPLAEVMWPGIDTNGRSAYNQMNEDLKRRVEMLANSAYPIHPVVNGPPIASTGERIAKLSCNCASDPIQVDVRGPVYHSHLCGCSKCWKPGDALFALTAVTPAGSVVIRSGADKLALVDQTQSVQRYACTRCGAHVVGKVENPDHHFYGLEFIHPELSAVAVPIPEFAGFVSSIVGNGMPASRMVGVRRQLADLGIPAYDAFSPELMDIIAWHQTKL